MVRHRNQHVVDGTRLLSRLLLLLGMSALVFSLLWTGLLQAGVKDSATALVAELQKGGYVLFLRHGATDHSQSDSDVTDLSHCDKQRNLSAQGRSESRLLGAAFAKLHIPVGDILTSPYCRCIETAKLAFSRYNITDSLQASFSAAPEESRLRADFLNRQLSLTPPSGKNTILVSHTANLRDAAGIWPKPEGVLLVFKPLGNGHYRYLGKIAPDQWSGIGGVD